MAKRILFQTALDKGYISKEQLQQVEEYRWKQMYPMSEPCLI